MTEFVSFDYNDLIVRLKQQQKPVAIIANNSSQLYLSTETIKKFPNEQLKQHVTQILTRDSNTDVFPLIVRVRK
jgi:biopolymer transport protein ExbD